MSEVEFCWVIRRDDGMFYCGWDFYNTIFIKEHFTKSLAKAVLKKCVFSEKNAHWEIKQMDLKNCRPVKIEMRVVEE